MSEASNSNFLPKAIIAVLVLIIAYLFFFNNVKSETLKDNSLIISSSTKTPEFSGKVSHPTNDLDKKTLLKLKKLINESTVFIAIDKNGNRKMLGNDLEPGEPCTPGVNLKNTKASNCTSFKKVAQLLRAESSTLLISKGSHITTDIVNGVATQICYNENYERITCE